VSTQRPKLHKKKLVIAVSLAMLGGAMTGCSSSSSSAAKGIYTITGIGGNTATLATNGYSGYGGYVNVYNYGGTKGAEIRKSGKANAKFSQPFKAPKVNLGTNPLMVAADTALTLLPVDAVNPVLDGNGFFTAGSLYLDNADQIRVVAVDGPADYAADALLAAGTPYITTGSGPANNSYTVFISAGGVVGNDAVVTGVSVAAGATLTFGHNDGCGSDVRFDNDIDNSGTITMLGSCTLFLNAGNYVSSATGSLNTAGIMTDTWGGYISLSVANAIANSGPISTHGYDNVDPMAPGNGGYGGEVTFYAGGYILNSGAVNLSGGDGIGYGGEGGSFLMYAAYVENTADVDLSGGDNVDPQSADLMTGTYGGGGTAGRMAFGGEFVVNNSGDVDDHGGNGNYGGSSRIGGYWCCGYFGAYYNFLVMYNNKTGEVNNTGNFNLTGGNGTTYGGGDGGELSMYTFGGDIKNSGDMMARGGDSMSATNGYAGDGGEFNFIANPGSSYNMGHDGGINHEPTGSIEISGNFEFSGGDATGGVQMGNPTYAGSGGYIYANLDGGEAAQRVALLGYTTMDLYGGNGGISGGGGGSVRVYTGSVFNPQTQEYTIGSALNEVPVDMHGGDSDNATDGGRGGNGGGLSVGTANGPWIYKEKATATNKGDVDISGGTGNLLGTSTGYYTLGGYGGELSMYSNSGTENTGNVTANAGFGSNGGSGGYMYMTSYVGNTTNSGDFTANGADGARYGGNGGYFFVYGVKSKNTGDISVNGSNGTDPENAFMESYGGNGGGIAITANGLTGATNNGATSYAGGTGITENGQEGCLQVNITFTGNCN